jgi:hemin uptake protein HemP
MTDLNRSSTLSLRRSGTSALTATRTTSSRAATPVQPRKPAEPAAVQATGNERALDSTALLQGRSHVSIMHNGETYQLRATRLGKLILTK